MCTHSLTIALIPICRRYSEYGKAPIVFVCTDSRSRKLDLAYTLFGEAIRTKYGIDSMAFNAVSSTLLKRALKRIAAIMTQPAFRQHYKTVASDAVDSIVLTAQGDLRNAMITMHMAAQKGEVPLICQQQQQKTLVTFLSIDRFRNTSDATNRYEKIIQQ